MANALSNLSILSEEFIHRHGPELLEKSLQPKMEHILLMRLSDLQHTLYELYIQVCTPSILTLSHAHSHMFVMLFVISSHSSCPEVLPDSAF